MSYTIRLGTLWLDYEFCGLEEDFGVRRYMREKIELPPATDDKWLTVASDMPTREAMRAVFLRKGTRTVDTIELPNKEAVFALFYWLSQLSICADMDALERSDPDQANTHARWQRGLRSMSKQLAKQGLADIYALVSEWRQKR